MTSPAVTITGSGISSYVSPSGCFAADYDTACSRIIRVIHTPRVRINLDVMQRFIAVTSFTDPDLAVFRHKHVMTPVTHILIGHTRLRYEHTRVVVGVFITEHVNRLRKAAVINACIMTVVTGTCSHVVAV
jgi:hypothetical protein